MMRSQQDVILPKNRIFRSAAGSAAFSWMIGNMQLQRRQPADLMPIAHRVKAVRSGALSVRTWTAKRLPSASAFLDHLGQRALLITVF
jgi:hypothetical protein